MKNLVIATNNRHKVKELRSLLSDLPLEILALYELPNPPDLIEDGHTFGENALKKARLVFERTKMATLADDSGLEVFYLNRRPGVRSARYAGEKATDDENNLKLLWEMKGVAPRRRRAQFRATIAVISDGISEVVEGVCLGKLAESPRGTNGFGYDPIFIPDGFDRTYAQLSDDEKNQISHRAQAVKKITDVLKRI